MRINTVRLRLILGWLGTLLPFIVACLAGFIPGSISETYYYNQCITPFMIILGSSSILLMCYKGYETIDDIILTCAGIFGLGICLFPTWPPINGIGEYVGTFQLHRMVSTTIHNVSAIAFFALLSYNSIFLFTKGGSNPTKNKKIRNIIYIVSGICMLASFLLMLLPDFRIKIWVVETIALFFFGLSFLTKADVYPWLFCDTPDKDEE